MMIKILKDIGVKVDNMDDKMGEFQQRYRTYEK